MQDQWYDHTAQCLGQMVQQFINYLDKIKAELKPYLDEY
jgi:hypothetical protein